MEWKAKRGIARICASPDDLRQVLDNSAPLDAVLDLLRSDPGDLASLIGVLDALHSALQQAGDQLGLYGEAARGVPSGLGPGRRTDVVFHCPQGRCARSERPGPGVTERPRCTLFDEDLGWIAWTAS